MVQLKRNLAPLRDEPFEQQLKSVAAQVEDVLDHILSPPTTRLHEAMRYSVLGGGKRLRAFLVYATSHLYSVPLEIALKTGAALEIVHAYSLVHDDLPAMDDATLRRNKPTCHKAYGEATAVLVGDALIPLAFEMLSSLPLSKAARLVLIKALSKVIGSQGLVAGQMMDLGQEGPKTNVKDLLELQRLKTGLFFSFATEAGAFLGGAPLKDREALKNFGLLFGQMFQMVDDWLDGCAAEKVTGKSAQQDKDKVTFLSLLGPTVLQEQAKKTLEEALEVIAPFSEKADLLKEAGYYAFRCAK
ncbi:MAG TPA: farnesyl-diphosphate synthase [Holosporales bacterium]|nr:farnesyl-diphosphate synthase [Holosporales bacterium]